MGLLNSLKSELHRLLTHTAQDIGDSKSTFWSFGIHLDSNFPFANLECASLHTSQFFFAFFLLSWWLCFLCSTSFCSLGPPATIVIKTKNYQTRIVWKAHKALLNLQFSMPGASSVTDLIHIPFVRLQSHWGLEAAEGLVGLVTI